MKRKIEIYCMWLFPCSDLEKKYIFFILILLLFLFTFFAWRKWCYLFIHSTICTSSFHCMLACTYFPSSSSSFLVSSFFLCQNGSFAYSRQNKVPRSFKRFYFGFCFTNAEKLTKHLVFVFPLSHDNSNLEAKHYKEEKYTSV